VLDGRNGNGRSRQGGSGKVWEGGIGLGEGMIRSVSCERRNMRGAGGGQFDEE
jgi:hypothetical protein